MKKDEESEVHLDLADIEEAYRDKEYTDYVKELEKVDYTNWLFDDKEEIEKINGLWAGLQDLKESAPLEERFDRFLPLYKALYAHIRRVNPFWGVGMDRLSIWERLQDIFRTVYTVNISDFDLYKNLVPEDMEGLIEKEDHYAIGSTRLKDGKRAAAGIIIFDVIRPENRNDETKARIDWIYVAEEFRGQNVADDLMAAMYNTLNLSGVTALTCAIPAADVFPATVGNFLYAWSISFSLEPMEEYTTDLKELLSVKALSGAVDDPRIECLGEMGEEQFTKSVEKIMHNSGEKTFEITDVESLDEELSVIRKGKNGNVVLLVDKITSDILEIRLLGGDCEDEKIYREVLKYALSIAYEIYDKKTVVRIKPTSQSSCRLIDRLLPKHGLPMYLIGGNITPEEDITSEDFEELRQMHEDEANGEEEDK